MATAEKDTEWKNARQWIISTGVSMDNKSMQYSENLLEFAESLRDGIILCAIANLMKPECVKYMKKVKKIEQNEFLCKRNIDLFLRACRETFHIDEKHLFQTNDLYHLVNFKAVLSTLIVLSKKREATDFLRWTPILSQKKKAVNHEADEELYGRLPDIIDQRVTDHSYDKPAEEEENIYDEAEKIYSSSTYDSLVNVIPPISKLTVQTQTLSKRDHIINELLDTESGYVKHLDSMVKHYIPTLESHMSTDDKKLIFMNTEKIYMLHLNFQRELKNETSLRTAPSPADAPKINISSFLQFKEQFLLYAFYCTHLDEAQKRVSELTSKVHGFRNTVDELNKKFDRKFPLQEQLAVCFQRVLKYPLLLRDLKKATSEDHADYGAIQEAFDAMDDVAKYINEYRRDTEVVSEIKHIEGTLKFEAFQSFNQSSHSRDYGRHIKDGELQVQFDSSDRKEKRFSFLFEHALLLCKSKGDTNEVKEVYDLEKFILEDVPTTGKGNFTHCLKLKARIPDGVSDHKNCKIYTKTQQMKIHWISAMTKSMEAVTLSEFDGKLKTHNFSLTTFRNEDGSEKNEKCGVCKKLLLGLISQGYRCTKCMLVVHRGCLLDCPACHQQPSRHVSHVIKKKDRVPRDKRAKTLDMSSANPDMRLPEEPKRASIHKQKSLDTYGWFAGILSRDQANVMLKGYPNGAFLIRESERGGMVVSVQYDNTTFHIKITEKNGAVYLTDAKPFGSVDELITYYKSNSLGASFPTVPSELTQIVRKPTKRSMIAIHDWQAQSAKELSLRAGDVISVLQDDGNWWVGVSSRSGEQGYFPSNYVQ